MSHPPEKGRDRRALWLLIGGIISLILPLFGVFYLKMLDLTQPNKIPGAGFFTKKGAEILETPPAPLKNPEPSSAAPRKSTNKKGSSRPSPSSSLSFIRGGGEYYQEEASPPPAPTPAPPPKPAPKALPKKTTAAKKPVPKPKLKPTGLSNFKGGQGLEGPQPAVPDLNPMLEKLQNLPNPTGNGEIQ